MKKRVLSLLMALTLCLTTLPTAVFADVTENGRYPALLREVLLCKSIAKIRNVPFPRPCGATGNDAQKEKEYL